MNDDQSTRGRGRGLFVLAAAAFVLGGVVFLPSFQYRINPDATAYVSIARQYAAGGFARAVNGYWGPLFSWLMAPLLAAGLGARPLLAGRIVQLAAGLGTLFAVRWLARQLGASPRAAGIAALCLAAPLLNYSLNIVTPDILLVFLLVLYCGVVLPDAYRGSRRRGAWAGLFAGLAYLAKAYALPFFLAHFVVINLIHLYRAGGEGARGREGDEQATRGRGDAGTRGRGDENQSRLAASASERVSDRVSEHVSEKLAKADIPNRRRAVLRNFAAGLVVFALVAGPWIGLLSHKYGRFTFGTAGQRAYAIVGPEYIGDDPVFQTLVAPPSFDATSYWNDPTVGPQLDTWRPWWSWDLFDYQLGLIGDNLWAMAWQITLLLPFAVVTLLCFIGMILDGPREKRGHPSFSVKPAGTTEPAGGPPTSGPASVLTQEKEGCPLFSNYAQSLVRKAAMPLLLTVAIFAGGYMPIFVEMRYLWLVVVLLVLMTVLLIEWFDAAHRFSGGVWFFLAAWLVLTCSVGPLNELVGQANFGKTPNGFGHAKLAGVLARQYGLHGNLASNGNWTKSLFAAFWMNGRYFGQIQIPASQPDGAVSQPAGTTVLAGPPTSAGLPATAANAAKDKERAKALADLEAELLALDIDYCLIWQADGNTERPLPDPLAGSRFPEITLGRLTGAVPSETLRIYAIKGAATRP